RPVGSVRGGDDDGLDIGPGQERLVRLVGFDPELLGQRGGAFATPDGHEPAVWHVPGQTRGVCPAHVAGADDRHPDGAHSSPPAGATLGPADRSTPPTSASILPPIRSGSPGSSSRGGQLWNGTAKTASNASAWRDGRPRSSA